jgi:hypothetical protein
VLSQFGGNLDSRRLESVGSRVKDERRGGCEVEGEWRGKLRRVSGDGGKGLRVGYEELGSREDLLDWLCSDGLRSWCSSS